MGKSFMVVLTILHLLCFGCATTKVGVNMSYEIDKVKRVAVLPLVGLKDYPEIGNTVSNEMVNSLVKYQFRVVERMLLGQIISEQKLGQSGVIYFDEMKKLGEILAVDAVIIGAVERFKPEKSDKVAYMPQEFKAKALEKGVALEPAPSYTYVSPHAEFDFGSVAVSFRLVDVQTGEIIASGSDSEYAGTAAIAIQELTDRFAKQLRKEFTKWEERKKKQ